MLANHTLQWTGGQRRFAARWPNPQVKGGFAPAAERQR